MIKKERGISFEEVLIEIEESRILDIAQNPSGKRKNQYVLILEMNEYIYLVSFVISTDKNEIFLKTIYPSRKHTKIYKNKT